MEDKQGTIIMIRLLKEAGESEGCDLAEVDFENLFIKYT